MAIKLSDFGGTFALSQDTTPQLGGNLDTFDFNIYNSVSDTTVSISGLKYPALDGIPGEIITTDGNGTLSFGTTSFKLLNDINSTFIPNGYLRWNASADTIIYTDTIDSDDIIGLATVAKSGSYNDLIDTPAMPEVLSDLNDVNTTGVSATQVLTWNSATWVPQTVNYDNLSNTPDLSIYVEDSDLSEVATDGLFGSLVDINLDTVPPVIGETVLYDGTNWVPGFPDATVSKLTDVGDVDTAGLLNEQVLKWNESEQTWKPANDLVGGSGGATRLDELDDVSFSGLVDTQYMRYEQASATWKNVYASYNDLIDTPIVPLILDDLTDVDTSTVAPITNNILYFNGSTWVPGIDTTREITTVIDVSPNGDDTTGNGSQVNPVKTIKKAVEIADTIIGALDVDVYIRLGPGFYIEDNPIVITTNKISLGSLFPYAGSIQNANLSAPLFEVSSPNPDGGFDVSAISFIGNADNIVNPGSHGIVYNGQGLYRITNCFFTSFDDALSDGADQAIVRKNVLVTQTGIKNVNVGGRLKDTLGQWFADNCDITQILDSGFIVEDGELISKPVFFDMSATMTGNATGIRVIDGIARANITDFFNCALGAEVIGTGEIEINSCTFRGCDTEISQTNPMGIMIMLNSDIDLDKVVITDSSNISLVSSLLTNTETSFIVSRDDESVQLYKGTVQTEKGTVSLPGHTFIDKTDTGMFLTVNDDLAFAVAGTPNIISDNTGNTNVLGNLQVNSNNFSIVAFSGNYDDLINTPDVPVNLSDLDDVTTVGATDGQVIKYNGLSWEPQDDINSDTLSEMTDTDILNPVLDNALVYTGTKWINSVINYDSISNKPDIPDNTDFTLLGLSDTDGTSVNDGYLRWNASGDTVMYQSTIPATVITGLEEVATVGRLSSLVDVDVTTTPVTDGQILRYDDASANWLPSDDTVTSVDGRTGIVTLDDLYANIIHTHTKVDITDFNDADYATSEQGALADSALQPGQVDNVSELINDALYIADGDTIDNGTY